MRFKERILAPLGAVTIPTIIFVGLLILTMRSYVSEKRLEVELLVAESSPPIELEEEPDSGEQDDEENETKVEFEFVNADAEMTEVPTMDSIIPANSMIIAEAPTPFNPDTVAMVKSPVTMKTLAGSARSASGRKAAFGKFGGEGTDKTVMRALRWIKAQQNEDGSWNFKGEGDSTAFALLAFLSHGEGIESKEFGRVVKRAVQYLMKHHENNMATYALIEAAAMVPVPLVKDAAKEALMTMCEKQKPIKNANKGSVIARFCSVMALKSAELARISLPKTARTRDILEAAYLAMREEKADNFDRIKGKGTWHYMIAGVCLQYLGHGEESHTRKMIHHLSSVWPPATLGTTEIACCPVRSNLFSTMIFFNAGGDYWRRWNEGMLAAYVDSQQIEIVEGEERGYWTCADEHIGEQPFWTTCYIAHQLMVYYRYLPTYSAEAWGTGAISSKDEDEELGFEVEVDI